MDALQNIGVGTGGPGDFSHRGPVCCGVPPPKLQNIGVQRLGAAYLHHLQRLFTNFHWRKDLKSSLALRQELA
jgi:hypothetical protein